MNFLGKQQSSNFFLHRQMYYDFPFSRILAFNRQMDNSIKQAQERLRIEMEEHFKKLREKITESIKVRTTLEIHSHS